MSEIQQKYGNTLPAERAIEYQVSGQAVKLTPGMVRQYLVTGKSELVTDQEIVYFMHICRARGLNPFNKDCYLVKYSQDPAAIIVSIDKLRYQARKSADCVGWKSGVIVQKQGGELRYSNGLILDGEKLLGGWFEGKPKGWEEPFRLEVNLNGYIKKTRDGQTTQFWQPDKQPMMIAKVAEAQGLRRLWPEQMQGLFVQEEISAGLHDEPPIDIEVAKPAELQPTEWCDELSDLTATDHFGEFVSVTKQANRTTDAELIRAANSDPSGFRAAFHSWLVKRPVAQSTEQRQRKPRSDKGQPRRQAPADPTPTPDKDQEPPAEEPPPAQWETAEREPGDEPPPMSEELLLDERRAELAELEKTHKYFVLEAKKRTGIAHPMTIDAYDEIIRQVWLIRNEKSK